MLIAIGSDDSFHLGVLSSRHHCEWVLRAGGWLGMGNDNRYSKSRVFDPFPFPDATPEQRARIAELAEERLPDGRQRVVKHGHGPEREIQTGIGALEVRRPKVRDRAADVESGEKLPVGADEVEAYRTEVRAFLARTRAAILRAGFKHVQLRTPEEGEDVERAAMAALIRAGILTKR